MICISIVFISISIIMIVINQVIQRKTINLIDKRLSRNDEEIYERYVEIRKELRAVQSAIRLGVQCGHKDFIK